MPTHEILEYIDPLTSCPLQGQLSPLRMHVAFNARIINKCTVCRYFWVFSSTPTIAHRRKPRPKCTILSQVWRCRRAMRNPLPWLETIWLSRFTGVFSALHFRVGYSGNLHQDICYNALYTGRLFIKKWIEIKIYGTNYYSIHGHWVRSE